MPVLITLHATCVAVAGRGLLILGPSGSGKSSLALQMIALGAKLVADDRTRLHRNGHEVMLSCPPALAGLIEARGLGLLRAPVHPPCPLALVADLGAPEAARLPEGREVKLLGRSFPLIGGVDGPHFPAAVMLHLTSGRAAP